MSTLRFTRGPRAILYSLMLSYKALLLSSDVSFEKKQDLALAFAPTILSVAAETTVRGNIDMLGHGSFPLELLEHDDLKLSFSVRSNMSVRIEYNPNHQLTVHQFHSLFHETIRNLILNNSKAPIILAETHFYSSTIPDLDFPEFLTTVLRHVKHYGGSNLNLLYRLELWRDLCRLMDEKKIDNLMSPYISTVDQKSGDEYILWLHEAIQTSDNPMETPYTPPTEALVYRPYLDRNDPDYFTATFMWIVPDEGHITDEEFSSHVDQLREDLFNFEF